MANGILHRVRPGGSIVDRQDALATASPRNLFNTRPSNKESSAEKVIDPRWYVDNRRGTSVYRCLHKELLKAG